MATSDHDDNDGDGVWFDLDPNHLEEAVDAMRTVAMDLRIAADRAMTVSECGDGLRERLLRDDAERLERAAAPLAEVLKDIRAFEAEES